MKKYLLLLFVLALAVFAFSFSYYKRHHHRCDVTIMGPIQFADGIGRQSVGLIEALRNTFSIQYRKHGDCEFKDVSKLIQKIATRKYQKTSKVLIYESPILSHESASFPQIPEADIRIAYSMFESTEIPTSWVMILNTLFDAVAVPDPFLVDVYKNSGVQIPIFELPLGMYLKPFFKASFLHEKSKDQPFVFGNLSSICERKNQLALVQAFAKEFGNNPRFKLILNGRYSDKKYFKLVKDSIGSLGLKNTSLTNIALRQKDYIRVLNTIDCYVSASIGEGFSLQPREALAIGIPSIVTDNTAQTTICLSRYVRSVPSNIPVKAKYRGWSEFLGIQYNATIDDLAYALRDVYENYEFHAQKAFAAKTWIKQYEYANLLSSYKTLICPGKVVLSDRNEIKDGILYTSSTKLKERYEKIQKEQTFIRRFFNFFIIFFQK